MTSNLKFRETAEALSAMWGRRVADGRLPGCCSSPIGPSYYEALYAGSMVQSTAATVGEHLSTTGIHAQHLMRWGAQGSPQFNLTASVAAAFVLTDTTELRWEDVRFPFETLVITMPSPSPITFDDFEGKEQEVRAIMVAQCFTPSVPFETTAAIFRRLEQARKDGVDVEGQRRILAELDEVPTLWVQGDDSNAQGIHRFYTKHTDPIQTLAAWCDPDVVGEWQTERSRFAMSLVCRVVACLALYLDHSEGPEQRWDPSRLKANRAKDKPTTWDIGREIKLPRDLREAARMLGRSDRSPAPWAVESRKWVRGHWRQQPFGKGRLERRRQWIMPYPKGSETAAVVPSMYQVGSK